MLVLTRREGETIVIGDDIRITVNDVHGDRVRLGVQAPKTILIDRAEVHVRRLSSRASPSTGIRRPQRKH
jgi:carbon storage regulator